MRSGLTLLFALGLALGLGLGCGVGMPGDGEVEEEGYEVRLGELYEPEWGEGEIAGSYRTAVMMSRYAGLSLEMEGGLKERLGIRELLGNWGVVDECRREIDGVALLRSREDYWEQGVMCVGYRLMNSGGYGWEGMGKAGQLKAMRGLAFWTYGAMYWLKGEAGELRGLELTGGFRGSSGCLEGHGTEEGWESGDIEGWYGELLGKLGRCVGGGEELLLGSYRGLLATGDREKVEGLYGEERGRYKGMGWYLGQLGKGELEEGFEWAGGLGGLPCREKLLLGEELGECYLWEWERRGRGSGVGLVEGEYEVLLLEGYLGVVDWEEMAEWAMWWWVDSWRGCVLEVGYDGDFVGARYGDYVEKLEGFEGCMERELAGLPGEGDIEGFD